MSALDSVNPALTRYGRKEPAPVLPLREEPDLLSWLETSGRLVEDEESSSPEVSNKESSGIPYGSESDSTMGEDSSSSSCTARCGRSCCAAVQG